MKPTLLLCILLISTGAFSQDSTKLRKKYTFKAIVELKGDQPATRAYFADVTDSAILLTQTPTRFRRLQQNANPTTLSYDQIQSLTLFRKGSVGRGALYGSLAGAMLGGLIGKAVATPCQDCTGDFTTTVSVIGGSMLGATTGCFVGIIVGALSKRTYIIGGQRKKFARMKISVLDRAYSQW